MKIYIVQVSYYIEFITRRVYRVNKENKKGGRKIVWRYIRRKTKADISCEYKGKYL